MRDVAIVGLVTALRFAVIGSHRFFMTAVGRKWILR